MVQESASPTVIARFGASSSSTGSEPGCAVQTGQMREFGSPPKPASQPQKSFVLVASWQCTSSPITGSNAAAALFTSAATRRSCSGHARRVAGREVEREQLLELARDAQHPEVGAGRPLQLRA